MGYKNVWTVKKGTMDMKIKHDFHIHTDLSLCARESAKLDNYVEISRKLGLEKIGIANHFWDSNIDAGDDFFRDEFYKVQDFEHILKIKSEINRSNSDDLKIYFGGEAEYAPMHRDISVSEEVAEQLDFLLVPNSHTHMTMPKEYYESYQRHIDFMLQAYEDIINSKVSRYITAVAHPFDAICCPYDREILINMISSDTFKRLFHKTASKEIAVELNIAYMRDFSKNYQDIENGAHIRMFRLAKDCGCKFIFGSDAHDADCHKRYHEFTKVFIDLLELKEDDIAEIAR